jgi:hypothetical protein
MDSNFVQFLKIKGRLFYNSKCDERLWFDMNIYKMCGLKHKFCLHYVALWRLRCISTWQSWFWKCRIWGIWRWTWYHSFFYIFFIPHRKRTGCVSFLLLFYSASKWSGGIYFSFLGIFISNLFQNVNLFFFVICLVNTKCMYLTINKPVYVPRRKSPVISAQTI